MSRVLESSFFYSWISKLASPWQGSFTYQILKGVYIFGVNVLQNSSVARVFVPGRTANAPGAAGAATMELLRRRGSRAILSLCRLGEKASERSLIKKLWFALSSDLKEALFPSVSASIFGFTTVYFSLSFLSFKLGGLTYTATALILFLFSLVGLLLPVRYSSGSILTFLSLRSRTESRHGVLWILFGSLLGLLSFLSSPLIILILCISFLFLLKVLRSPETGLYAVFAYPLLDFAIRSSLSSTLGKLWSFVLLALLFFAIFWRMGLEKERHFSSSEAALPLLVLLLWCSVSLAFNQVSFEVGFEGVRAILQTSLFFFATLNALRSRKGLRPLFFTLGLVIAIISLYAVYQYMVQIPVKPGWVDVDFEQNIKSRSYSIFPSPNGLSGYLVLFIPLLLVLFFEERKALQKLFFFSVLGLAALALLFTLTRAAWLACGLSLLLLGILHDRRVLVVLLIILIAVPFVPLLAQRFDTLISGQYWVKSATAGRLYRWELALEIADGSPLLGSGPGTFGGAVAYRAGYWPGIYADNYYLKTAAELGYAGLAIFGLLALTLIVGGFRRINSIKEKNLKNIGWSLQTGLIAFLIHNFTENLWEEPSLAVGFWAMSAFLFALPLLKKDGQEA